MARNPNCQSRPLIYDACMCVLVMTLQLQMTTQARVDSAGIEQCVSPIIQKFKYKKDTFVVGQDQLGDIQGGELPFFFNEFIKEPNSYFYLRTARGQILISLV